MCDKIAGLFGLTPDAPHFQQALTHPSYANERSGVEDNQRLEFLGDAVLGFCTSRWLYSRFPDADEGTLTRMRSELVSAQALAHWAEQHDLADALLLGRGAESAGLKHSRNVLSDATEALIAATYLDMGLDQACSICEKIVGFVLRSLQVAGARDPKSELQERVQALGLNPPTYVVTNSGGPAHARWFEVDVLVNEERTGSGRGSSKRAAEREAAESALESARFQAGAGAESAPTSTTSGTDQ